MNFGCGQQAHVQRTGVTVRGEVQTDRRLWVPKTSSALIDPGFSGRGLPGMILGCGSAPRLPDDQPTVRVAAAVTAYRVVEERRTLAAAPSQGPTQDELGRPGTDRAPARRHSQTPPWRPAFDCHAADRPALAP